MKVIPTEKILEILSDLRAGYNCFDRDELAGYEAISDAIARLNENSFIEPKYGEWKWRLADNGWKDIYCSECGYTKNVDIHVRLGWNFCPNCGADMREYISE